MSQEELRRAVDKVGPMADDVEGWLQGPERSEDQGSGMDSDPRSTSSDAPSG